MAEAQVSQLYTNISPRQRGKIAGWSLVLVWQVRVDLERKNKGEQWSSTRHNKTSWQISLTNSGHWFCSSCICPTQTVLLWDTLLVSQSSQCFGEKSLSLAGGSLLVFFTYWLFFTACSFSKFLTESLSPYFRCPFFLSRLCCWHLCSTLELNGMHFTIWNDYCHLAALAGKAMATHSSVLAWRIPGMEEPGGLPSLGSHRVGHYWSDLAAAAAAAALGSFYLTFFSSSD